MTVDENALAALVVANSEFDEIERSRNVFCPFEAVGMVQQEVRHGHFLSYVFDSQRPHGFGSDCIRALLAGAAKSGDRFLGGLQPIDVHLMEFDNAVVRREWKGIDILIDVPNQQGRLIIAVELKIDASEHSGQLGRYKAAVESEWPNARHIFLFLTKRGDDPSEDDGEGWVPIEMEVLAEELDEIVRRGRGVAEARELLRLYLSMLRRHHLTDDRLEQLAASLWAKHREALEYLADQRPDAASDVFRRLFEDRESMAKEFSEKAEFEITPDHSSPSHVRFAIPAWDAIPGFRTADWTPSRRVLMIELAKAGSRAARIRFQLGPGEKDVRERIFNALSDGKADLGARKKLSAEWNRLASRTIAKFKDDELDVDATVEAIKAAATKFVVDHGPVYNKILLSLGRVERKR